VSSVGQILSRAGVSIAVRISGSSHKVSLLRFGVVWRSDFEDLPNHEKRGAVIYRSGIVAPSRTESGPCSNSKTRDLCFKDRRKC
jgi:hypothetical protein